MLKAGHLLSLMAGLKHKYGKGWPFLEYNKKQPKGSS